MSSRNCALGHALELVEEGAMASEPKFDQFSGVPAFRAQGFERI